VSWVTAARLVSTVRSAVFSDRRWRSKERARSTLQADIATEAGRVISAVRALCWRRGATRKEGSRRSEPTIRRAVAQVVEHLLSNIQG
jgi:hypothetical protein